MASPREADPSPSGDMPTRPMRVKVLYTFDTESKTTCLARLSETLHIPIAEIDETTHIGVITLQRCLQSITSASPELLPPLHNNDYAIYAFDYSEADLPLVGQGMLSTALAQTSNPNAAMITGRVCQNVPAIFSNGVKETLEVKLRLVPVKQQVQPSGSASPRSGNTARSGGFDPNAWNNAMNQGRSPPGQDTLGMDLDPGRTDGDQSVLDEIFRQTGNLLTTQSTIDSGLGESPAFSAAFQSAPGSRAGSPMLGGDESHIRHYSFSTGNSHQRPSSRASLRSEHQTSLGTVSHMQAGPTYDEYLDDDGQPRKRAKITQTDWRGRSSFGGKTGNLRMTAATAASMEMHRPVATRPSALPHGLEPPPRVPTPVPQASGPRRMARSSLGARSLLRQASTMSTDFMSDVDNTSDAIASSPEDDSPGNSAGGFTPQDFPSSPPVFAGMTRGSTYSPGPPSNTWHNTDSGYMSEKYRAEDTASNACSPDFGVQPPLRPLIKREGSTIDGIADSFPFDLNSDAMFDTDLPHQDTLSLEWPGNSQAHKIRAPSPAMPGHGSRRGSLALPTLAPAGAQHAGAKKRQSSQQPRSFYMDSEAGSPAPSEYDGRPVGPKRSGSGAHRRKVIQDRLHTAIAKGEMPQYCAHCGAIETPTWRRLYVKVVEGRPSPLDEVEGEGEVVGVEQLAWNDKGDCTKFVIRKSMKKTKDSQPGKGFGDIQLCNPCGLWFSKTKQMRPQNKWGKRSGTRRSKKAARNAEGGDMTDGMEPPSEAFFTDSFMPDEGFDDLPTVSGGEAVGEHCSADGVDVAKHRPRSSESLAQQSREDSRWQDAASTARSSPGQNDGTADSPIELDDKTPKPTRRLLFPSPRQDGETKTLDNTDVLSRSSSGSRSKGSIPIADTSFTVLKATALNKENMPPLDESDIAGLIASPSRLFKTPQKTPLRRSPRSLAKLAALPGSPTPGSRKRKALAEHNGNANASKTSAHDFMTSPASSRYFLRSTPTRLANTPSRSSVSKRSQDVSPFSRQLAEMLAQDGSMVFNSPGNAFAFADLPTFASPSGQHIDWDNLEALMSSDFATIPEKSDTQPDESTIGNTADS